MDQTILDELRGKFQEIGSRFGFSNTIVKSSGHYTDIYLVGQHALQMEIDWRECNLFMYVVLLRDRKLPPQDVIYSYKDGHWCRKYLEEVYRTKRPRAPKPPLRYSQDYICAVFRFYSQLLENGGDVLRAFLLDLESI